jgi:hypothetical protein
VHVEAFDGQHWEQSAAALAHLSREPAARDRDD